MPTQALKSFLGNNHVKYTIITHSPEYTAQEIAASAHIPGKDLAKTVIVKIDGDFAMAVLPASMHVSLSALREAAGASDAEIATEEEFETLFPDCELGAMPPFGNLYDMPVYVDPTLERDETITFNGGTHEDAIRMQYEDFKRLVHPTRMDMIEAV